MNNKIITLGFLLLVSLNFVSALTYIDSCRVLDKQGETYVLSQDIVNNDLVNSCINITAQEITLDCAGFSVNSDDNYAGVYSNQINTTIKNCNISMGFGFRGAGIIIEYADNAYIYNNILSEQYQGLYLHYSNNSRVEYNIITSNSDTGILSYEGSNNEFLNNKVNLNYFGIWLYTSSNNILRDNILDLNNHGVYLQFADENNLFDNVISNCLTNQYGCLRFYNSNNNFVFGGSINSSLGDLIHLVLSEDNHFEDIQLSGDSRYGIYLSLSLNNFVSNMHYDLNDEFISLESSLYRQWYYNAQVNDDNGNAIDEANVSAYDKDNNSVDSEKTGSAGKAVLQLISYVNQNDNNKTYYSPYTIVVSKTGYISETKNYTAVDNNLDEVFVLISNNKCNNGCLFNKKCYSIGDKKGRFYCSDNGEFILNKLIGKCKNNFECFSNICKNESCVKGNLFRGIMGFFIKI